MPTVASYFAQLRLGDWIVVVAIVGWIVNYRFNRRLHRKQAAVAMLVRIQTTQTLVKERTEIFNFIRANPTYNWKELATRCFEHDSTLSDAERDRYNQLLVVLNFYENIAVAVISRAAHEQVIRFSLQSQFRDLRRAVGPMLSHVRELYDTPTYHEHFEHLAQMWYPNKASWWMRVWWWMEFRL